MSIRSELAKTIQLRNKRIVSKSGYIQMYNKRTFTKVID